MVPLQRNVNSNLQGRLLRMVGCVFAALLSSLLLIHVYLSAPAEATDSISTCC